MIRTHPNEQIEAGRQAVFYWSAKQVVSDGSERAIAFVSGDDVLWKIAATEGGAALLTLTKTPNGNGSKTIVDVLGDTSNPNPDLWTPASGRVIVQPADTLLVGSSTAGLRYDELLLQDSGDSNRLKTIVRGRVIVRPSQT